MSEIRGVSALQAWKIMQQDADSCLVDIRSNMEYLFVGHPADAHHIPWMDEPDWEENPQFVRQIEQIIAKTTASSKTNTSILLICRSGNRSLVAAQKLADAGFTNVMHITDGFEGDLDAQHHRSSLNGWRFAGLPWEQC